MDFNSKNKSYERAAIYRDKISALREIQRNQSITGYTKERDAIYIVSLNGITKIGVTHVNKGWITGHENFTQKNTSLESSLLSTFIKRHYFSSSYCPPVIVSSQQIPQKNILEMALSKFHGKQIKIITKPGKKDKGLMEITKSNTLLAVKRSTKNNKDISHIFNSVKDQLELKENIRIIESYDISHHAGAGAVGGCVVYSSKGKLKDKYRLFNISDINIQNDIASMQEVIRRRFFNQDLDLEKPSHILIDGGRAHLRAVENTLSSMNIKDIEVISISKGARRKAEFDTIHKTEGIFRVSKGSYPDLFIQELRDETHRFTITNQKKKQTKLSMKSALDNIQGIGAQKKKILLRYFGSIEQVEKAGFQDLLNVDGVGKKTAELIYNNLH
jgi:excinuclease ABC subunit C